MSLKINALKNEKIEITGITGQFAENGVFSNLSGQNRRKGCFCFRPNPPALFGRGNPFVQHLYFNFRMSPFSNYLIASFPNCLLTSHLLLSILLTAPC
jgi:hypothetical protein